MPETEGSNAKKPDFIYQTIIRCSQDALWDALTKADQIGAYHFVGDAAEGDAEIGKKTNILRADGSVMLTQTTLKLDPKSRIELTFEPHFMEGDNAPSSMVYLIRPEGDACMLTCEHYDIPAGQEGVKDGWARQIGSLKSWLETGVPIKMDLGG